MRVRTLVDPVYGAGFVFLVGTPAELRACRHPAAKLVAAPGPQTAGLYVQAPDTAPTMPHIIWLDRTDNDDRELALWHEAFHAAAHVLRERGLRLTPASEEAFAYFLTWVGRELRATWRDAVLAARRRAPRRSSRGARRSRRGSPARRRTTRPRG